MRRLMVADNWKMNTTRSSAESLAAAVAAGCPQPRDDVEVVVCPPFPYLSSVGDALQGSGVLLGAQNAYFEASGAFTGEVAVEMLLDVGCRYVILGHSERRHDETTSPGVAGIVLLEPAVYLAVETCGCHCYPISVIFRGDAENDSHYSGDLSTPAHRMWK